ncbi:hypothetical protein RHSIM_Rhsim08G0172500 [Rhododendron simsii]|uniref:Pentatricopeptide repeat-containing protein n=1 Tax=Rhododendron simsii TaxID=118357 RepID=A0A834GKP1_RHOSS|nr:hypothetical protein RHSIM_Rhsim08G0172500 [Rhododendron simsii]
MPERTVVTWTVLLSGYTQNGCSKEALLVFSAMRSKGVRPNQFAYGSALRACTSLMCLGRGEQIRGCIQKSRLAKDLFVQSALVDLFSKCGKREDACFFFESLAERDVVSWNVVIGGYANSGFADDAFQLFCLMLRGDLRRQSHALAFRCQPYNDVSMGNALIDMYSKSGEIEGAISVFNEMKQKNVISWTSLIVGYGKHGCGHKTIALYNRMEYEGKLEEAYNLICKMNIAPTASLWGAILGACHIYGNMSLREVAAMHLFNMEPEKSVNYVVLASIYASVGLWDSVFTTRRLMEERSIRKDPRYSLF